MPLPDRFIVDNLLEMFTLFDQARVRDCGTHDPAASTKSGSRLG